MIRIQHSVHHVLGAGILLTLVRPRHLTMRGDLGSWN